MLKLPYAYLKLSLMVLAFGLPIFPSWMNEANKSYKPVRKLHLIFMILKNLPHASIKISLMVLVFDH